MIKTEILESAGTIYLSIYDETGYVTAGQLPIEGTDAALIKTTGIQLYKDYQDTLNREQTVPQNIPKIITFTENDLY